MDIVKARELFGNDYIENTEDIPKLSLKDWRLVIEGFGKEIVITEQDLRKHEMKEIPTQFECDSCDRLPYTYTGVNILEFVNDEFLEACEEAIGIEVFCRDGYEAFLSTNKVFFDQLYLSFEKNGKPISHEIGGPVRGVFQHSKGKYSPRYIHKIKFVTNSRHDPHDPRYIKA